MYSILDAGRDSELSTQEDSAGEETSAGEVQGVDIDFENASRPDLQKLGTILRSFSPAVLAALPQMSEGDITRVAKGYAAVGHSAG